VNEHTDRIARHAAAVKGLTALRDWIEYDATLPVWDYLPVIIKAGSAEDVARIAETHDMPGPHTASDGTVWAFQAFGAGVTWQIQAPPRCAAVSTAEQRAHAWARQNGRLIVPVTDTLDRG